LLRVRDEWAAYELDVCVAMVEAGRDATGRGATGREGLRQGGTGERGFRSAAGMVMRRVEIRADGTWGE
jgi:hypothetical protein